MHPIYDLPRPLLWAAALLLAVLAVAPLLLLVPLARLLVNALGPAGLVLLVPGYLVLFLVSLPWIQLTTTPVMRLSGAYRYYSPMLLVENPRPTGYHIHGGTNLDYLLHLRWADRGPAAARKTLCHYLRGLLAIADEVARGELPPDTPIVASSYVFSASTARRLGFTVEPVPPGERLGLWMNLPNLLLKHSFAQGRPAFPDLTRVRRATTTGGRLVAQRGALRALLARLEGADGGGAAA